MSTKMDMHCDELNIYFSNCEFISFIQVSNMYKEYQGLICDDLANVPMVAFTLDGWTSPFQMSFLAVTAHWIDDNWVQHDVTLGFELLKGSHTGQLLMETFVKVMERFNLQQKVMSITSDNGSNVLKLAKDFETYTHQRPDEW